jgi:hypothetical protein
MFRSSPSDLPDPNAPKRVVFYFAALKIYGVIPFLLTRRVRGEFISNEWSSGAGGISFVAPTGEANYTLVPYQQSPASAHALLDWLYADAGFQWGIAEAFATPLCELRQVNWMRWPVTVWHPAGKRREGFSAVLQESSQTVQQALSCLLSDKQSTTTH